MVKTYTTMAARWVNILLGRSYHHVPQPKGRHFTRNGIGGYYNDLTRKAHWPGDTDESGIPLDMWVEGVPVYFPITISQMALGVYDLWFERRAPGEKERFLNLADWLLRNQDEEGGWVNPWTYVGKPSTISKYSAMAQGEAISVLARAFVMTADPPYLECARRAFALMARSALEGGCADYDGDAVFLEEYPDNPRNSVLNGWIFAIFGVYDLSLLTRDESVSRTLQATLKTLENNLEAYDMGYWSYYDRRGHVASPFYHALHSALLEALFEVTAIETFRTWSNRWRAHEKSAFNKSRAVVRKVWQKLRDPVKIQAVR